MFRVTPFSGLLYDPAVAGPIDAVTSPPYDVIGDDEQRRLIAANPHNVVQLEFNDHVGDPEGRAEQYRRAGGLLTAWRRSGALTLDEEPAYYPYEMEFIYAGAPRRIRGLIAAVEIEPWGGSIIPHEHTMPKQIDDRLGLIREVKANLSPVYSIYTEGLPEVERLLENVDRPLFELTDGDGVTHRLWRLRDERISGWFSDRDLLIADGHHRYTVALRYREEMRAAQGPGPWDQIMMLLVDASTQDPPVLPIHRVVLSGPALEEPPDEAGSVADALASVSDEGLTVAIVRHSGDGLRSGTTTLDGQPPAVCALHERLLDPLYSREDLRFTADADAAVAAVDAGEAIGAVLLPPTTAERIGEVIARGDRMPQKSTFFWPKPRTGLVIRPQD